MRTDKWVIALDHLNMNATDLGPTCHSTYDDLTTGWRGSDSLPSESELEAAYADGATARAWSALRTKRNRLLTETDFHAMSDNTMADNMKAYRKALRDLPASTDPANPTWPTKP